jgi:amino acid adenylation domain-containing protein
MSLHQLVIAAAARDPGAVAVAGPGGELRYGDLDRQANALAQVLAGHGVGPGDRVLIWLDKSPLAIIAMQAVLRLGAAYVPASGTTPVGRVAFMARDCGARVVCAPGVLHSLISAELRSDARCLNLDDRSWQHEGPGTPVNHLVQSSELAYILYTSGSTGTPKGVCISHGNARAFIDWAVHELGVQPGDRLANHAPFTFDLSVLDLYAAFAAGAAVCLVSAGLAYAPGRLADFLHRQRISIWYSVPSALIMMMRDGRLLDRAAPESLRAVLFAGEPFPIRYVRSLADWTSARLLNLYGPTETNVCTFHEVTPADLERDRPAPIGRPASGSKVWAEKPDGRAPHGDDTGELIVDGPTVMLGYWGSAPQLGPYRTGDIVRLLADGSFDYVGRDDYLVKVRGHRLELCEVEAALSSHHDAAEVAVITSGEGIDCRLLAFIVLRAEANSGILAFKRHCSVSLPPYMIPDEIFFVTKLPRTVNGKLDRAALIDVVQLSVKEPAS